MNGAMGQAEVSRDFAVGYIAAFVLSHKPLE
jgi:hypothetical protein